MKFIIILILFCSSVLQARVLDMTRESLASFFNFSYATSTIKDEPFVKESSATSFSAEYATNLTNQFGLIYLTKYMGLRFGFEIFKPTSLDEVEAKSSGSKVYKFHTRMNGFGPIGGIDLNLYTSSFQRVYFFGYAGSISLNMTSEYYEVGISPNGNHQAEIKGTGSLAGGGLGYEVAVFDTTTLELQLAYRQMTVSNLTYVKATTTFTGTKAVGDPVEDTDGNRRSISFTGYYAALGFRFYLF